MKGFTFILRFLLVIITFSASAQERCDNARDDDNDGLIDLKDPDCYCRFEVTGNLLQNGSFESFRNCPTYSYENDFRIAEGWQYGTYTNGSETNYYHNFHCAYDSSIFMHYIPPSLPLPDGDAFISIRQNVYRKPHIKETDIAKTYIGQCLEKPLMPGESYTLSFNAGRFQSRDDSDFKYKTEPFTVAVFGHADCNAVPFGQLRANSNGCPANYAGWVLLGKTTVYSKGRWVQSKIDFMVPFDVNSIAIGPDCSIPDTETELVDSTNRSDFYVYYLDDVHLLPTKEFHFLTIQNQNTDPCAIDSVLMAPQVPNAAYQWYKDSIAIIGASEVNYKLPQANRSGNYNVRITGNDACFVSASYSVSQDQLAALRLAQDTVLCLHDTLLAAPNLEGVTYTWNGVTSTEVKLTKGGVYHIQAAANGCRKTFEITVHEEDCENASMFIPNAFTPNSDGKNDVFRIPPGIRINLKAFAIYNRWGNAVFRTTDRSAGWDGTLNGKACSDGTYVYFIRGTINNKERLLKGTISLIR